MSCAQEHFVAGRKLGVGERAVHRDGGVCVCVCSGQPPSPPRLVREAALSVSTQTRGRAPYWLTQRTDCLSALQGPRQQSSNARGPRGPNIFQWVDPDAPSGRANDHAAPARPQPLAWPRRAERTEPASHTPICPATADHLRYLRAPGKGGARLHRGFIHCRGLPRRAVNTRISPTVCGGTHGTRWLAVTQLPAGRVEAVRPNRTPPPPNGTVVSVTATPHVTRL